MAGSAGGQIPAGCTNDQVNITMDWMPTLLTAAGASPDPAYPQEGMNLLPTLTQNAAPVSRKLFWRYTGNAQRAYRSGDYKILKILDQTFLFNVVADPHCQQCAFCRRASSRVYP